MSTLNGFEELESLAEKLNEESDQVNEIIKDFEDRLIKLNLGTEVWFGEGTSLSPLEPPLETWDDHETTFTIRLGFTSPDSACGPGQEERPAPCQGCSGRRGLCIGVELQGAGAAED